MEIWERWETGKKAQENSKNMKARFDMSECAKNAFIQKSAVGSTGKQNYSCGAEQLGETIPKRMRSEIFEQINKQKTVYR